MSNLIANVNDEITSLIHKSFQAAMEKQELAKAEVPKFTVEIPADTLHGDFATNAAMVSAKAFRTAPAKIAAALIENFDFASCEYIAEAEVAGPGFINFTLKQEWFGRVLCDIIKCGDNYGRSKFGNGEKVMVEFVSANPTGPMHMGNARGGAIGDCLAAALDAAGFDVTREFYINDAGNQIDKFGLSLEARYLQIYKGEDAIEFPEDGYHGVDIKERAQQFANEFGDKYVEVDPEERRKVLVDFALPLNIEKLRSDLSEYRIDFDVWFKESKLHNEGRIQEILDVLDGKDAIYKKDGAVWYKATNFGGEKDEVLIRANGFPTYFAADIAYHYNKFVTRGFNRVINVWGADHHGHVARLKGAMNALGLDGDKLDIVLMQLVRLMKEGKPVKMSKRTGKAITLSDLTKEIPIDAARFFFNMREPHSTLDFDLDLAVEQSASNPVYYVQYAHARICSIISKLEEEGIHRKELTVEDLDILTNKDEIELIRKLATYPNEIIGAAENYDPAKLTKYAADIATLFHKFYNSCRVKGEEEHVLQARLTLCKCVQITLKNVLTLLKISVPESM